MDEEISLQTYLEWLDENSHDSLWFEIDGNSAGQLAMHIRALMNRINRLETALRWYAENCAANGDKIEGPSGDYGKRARAALEK